MSRIEFFKKTEKKTTSPTAQFLNSFGMWIGIGLLALSDYLFIDKPWFQFPTNFIVNNVIGYSILFILAIVDHMAVCKSGSSYGYATTLATPATILYNIFFFMPPFNLIFFTLQMFPMMKYFANGILLQMAFYLVRMFLRCK